MVEEVAEQLEGRAELIVDGGIRRGTDILKAVALGARACMTGRVGLYGLAVGGEAGAARALKLLRSEYGREMAMLGGRRTARESVGGGRRGAGRVERGGRRI